MGYSYVFLGDLAFPTAAGLAAWRTTAGDDALRWLEGGPTAVDFGENTVRVRSIVDKGTDAWIEGRRELTEAFGKAPGAAGELVVAGWIDYPGAWGERTTVVPAGATTEELDEDEVSALEGTAAWAEVQALVDALVGDVDALIAEGQKLLDAKDAASRAAIAGASDMDDALAKLRGALPEVIQYGVKDTLQTHPAVRALAARREADADAKMEARLAAIVGKAAPWKRTISQGDQLVAGALVNALWARNAHRDAIVELWITAPQFFLRDHERVRGLGRPELDVRLAALLGTWLSVAGEDDNHRWIVDALLDSDPTGAPARATALLEGDIRKRPAALESLRWVVNHLYERPAANTPEWHAFARRVVLEGPPGSATAYDMFDQVRDSAVGLMALWRLPEALGEISARFDDLGVDRACELLEALGDEAAVPALEARLAATKRKPERSRIEKAIARLKGAPPPASAGHHIEIASSGRASCRGCKQKIAKGELRFGEAVDNVYSDSGELTMRWYHLTCAAAKRPKLLGPALAAYAGDVPDRADLEAQIAAATSKKKKKRA